MVEEVVGLSVQMMVLSHKKSRLGKAVWGKTKVKNREDIMD